MTDAPVTLEYQGDGAFHAVGVWSARCDKQFVVHERYRMVAHEERSKASHDQYFASLDERYDTLPESLEGEYPSRESLRHKALIRLGYCTEKDFILPSDALAIRFAAHLIEDDEECYCIIEVRGRVVRKYKALSQAYRAMGKKVFQKSKQDVLDFVDRLLGVQSPSLAPDAPPLADHQDERADEHALAQLGRGRG